MADAPRFYLDEQQSHALAAGLRAHGIDVLMAAEAGRLGFSDEEQLEFATAEGRVIVTFDVDYLALHATGTTHAGIAWCPSRKYSTGQLIAALTLVHGAMTAAELANKVEYL